MGLFRRKKQTDAAPEPTPAPTPCEIWGHLWQDFPWILTHGYNRNSIKYSSQIEISEPYVCRICGETKYMRLLYEGENISREAHDKKVKRLQEEFKDHIKPAPVVNDMINDMKLLDRERLAAWNRLHDDAPAEKRPFQLKLGTEVFDRK